MSAKETIWARAHLEYLTLAVIFTSACYIVIGHVFIWYKFQFKFNGTFALALAVFPLTALLVGKFFKNFNRGLLLLIAVCFIFALPLCGLFQTGASDGASIIGGLIPYSDAHGYYVSALRLNQGGAFDSSGRVADGGARREGKWQRGHGGMGGGDTGADGGNETE